GAELHGIIGYTFLARYRMEVDFTRDKMAWVPLDFDPPPPKSLGKGGAPVSLAAIGTIMKVVAALVGKQPEPELSPRGFLGIALAVCLACLTFPALGRADDEERKPIKVPFELLKSQHMVVKVKVNGAGPYRLIFDTGAPVTLINNKIAKAGGVFPKDFKRPPF